MMNVSKNFKGIEYVQVEELPSAQRERITETINNDLYIKIMIDGKIIKDCLQYKDYSFWYNSVFRQTINADEAAEHVPASVEYQSKLAYK